MACAGAEVLLHTAQRTFLHLIPWLILVGTLIFGISGPVSKWLRRRSRASGMSSHIFRAFALACALFPVCFYIGYFGAGGGFLVMTILALFGMEEMHALNAMKVVAAMLLEFVRDHHVHLSGSDRVALLPSVDGVCGVGRMGGCALCAAGERRCVARDCSCDGDGDCRHIFSGTGARDESDEDVDVRRLR